MHNASIHRKSHIVNSYQRTRDAVLEVSLVEMSGVEVDVRAKKVQAQRGSYPKHSHMAYSCRLTCMLSLSHTKHKNNIVPLAKKSIGQLANL